MNTATKVAGFAAGLLAAFGAAAGAGALVGPVGGVAGPETHSHSAEPGPAGSPHPVEPANPTEPGTSGHTGPAAGGASEPPAGLAVSEDGYSLDLGQRQLPAAGTTLLRFHILGPDGRPVTGYTRTHGKDLHLVVVRRDLTRFQHVHPRLAEDGTWSAQLDLPAAGVYRLFADFTPTASGRRLTLGADLAVAGNHQPRPLPAAATTAVVDGYVVRLAGRLVAGQESELTFSVSRDGRPVTDLQPYLQAYGHLVALRDRDLAYLHVHPAGSPRHGSTTSGPEVAFTVAAPSGGAYRLFLDFRHRGQVRTAGFTVTPEQTPAGHGHGG